MAGCNVGVEEFENEKNQITIYPNPTTSAFTISSTEKIKEVKIYNILGCEILFFDSSTGSLHAELRMTGQVQNVQSATIDISGIAKGIYFVEVRTEKRIQRKKLVKE